MGPLGSEQDFLSKHPKESRGGRDLLLHPQKKVQRFCPRPPDNPEEWPPEGGEAHWHDTRAATLFQVVGCSQSFRHFRVKTDTDSNVGAGQETDRGRPRA